jgi:hypothetical protein
MSDFQSTVDQAKDGELNTLNARLAAETERANKAEGRLRAHVLESALERAATRGRAFSTAQVTALLKPHGEVVQATDKDGRPLDGQFAVNVKGENGETLTPRQAVERLRASDANLFFTREDLQSSSPGPREGESNLQWLARIAKTNPDEYHRLRKERPELLGLRRRSR